MALGRLVIKKFHTNLKTQQHKKVSHLLLRGTNYLEFLTLSCPWQFHVFQPQNKTLKSGSIIGE
jgi:hypothetical protein